MPVFHPFQSDIKYVFTNTRKDVSTYRERERERERDVSACLYQASFFLILLVSVQVVHPYCRINETTAWKKSSFILSDRCDFHMTDSLRIAAHTFDSRVPMSFSIDETLLPRYVKFSTSFREPLLSVEITPLWLRHMYSVLSAFIWRPMLPVARSRLCITISAWVSVFARSAMSFA